MKKTTLFLATLILGFIILSCKSDPALESSGISNNDTGTESQPSEVNSPSTNESTNTVSTNDEIPSSDSKAVNTKKETIREEKSISAETPKSVAMSIQEEEIPTIVALEEPEESYDFHEYERWDKMLRSYVSSSGKVNYTSFKKDVATLDSVIQEFQDNYPGSGWNSTQKLTYWINAYNLFTIKLIVDNYPVSSITKITAKPWEKKFIQLGGKTYDLNTIENGIIRKQFNEPRIHFALNCASESCPILLNRAYTSSKLYGQLTTQTKKFLSDATKNDFSNTKSIKISSIFDWYGEDFKKSGTVIDFINKYRTEQLDNPKISYMTYSWDLND